MRKAKPAIEPNQAFRRQLMELEKEIKLYRDLTHNSKKYMKVSKVYKRTPEQEE